MHTLYTAALQSIIFFMWSKFINTPKHLTVHPPLHHHCEVQSISVEFTIARLSERL
jgi:hypothetical protein